MGRVYLQLTVVCALILAGLVGCRPGIGLLSRDTPTPSAVTRVVEPGPPPKRSETPLARATAVTALPTAQQPTPAAELVEIPDGQGGTFLLSPDVPIPPIASSLTTSGGHESHG